MVPAITAIAVPSSAVTRLERIGLVAVLSWVME